MSIGQGESILKPLKVDIYCVCKRKRRKEEAWLLTKYWSGCFSWTPETWEPRTEDGQHCTRGGIEISRKFPLYLEKEGPSFTKLIMDRQLKGAFNKEKALNIVEMFANVFDTSSEDWPGQRGICAM